MERADQISKLRSNLFRSVRTRSFAELGSRQLKLKTGEKRYAEIDPSLILNMPQAKLTDFGITLTPPSIKYELKFRGIGGFYVSVGIYEGKEALCNAIAECELMDERYRIEPNTEGEGLTLYQIRRWDREERKDLVAENRDGSAFAQIIADRALEDGRYVVVRQEKREIDTAKLAAALAVEVPSELYLRSDCRSPEEAFCAIVGRLTDDKGAFEAVNKTTDEEAPKRIEIRPTDPLEEGEDSSVYIDAGLVFKKYVKGLPLEQLLSYQYVTARARGLLMRERISDSIRIDGDLFDVIFDVEPILQCGVGDGLAFSPSISVMRYVPGPNLGGLSLFSEKHLKRFIDEVPNEEERMFLRNLSVKLDSRCRHTEKGELRLEIDRILEKITAILNSRLEMRGIEIVPANVKISVSLDEKRITLIITDLCGNITKLKSRDLSLL
ncbi:MAG: hypothetical protein WCV91_00320 [Candidatus Margulisiibacteriota bacterium]